jgi:hypothetical protein
LGQAWGRLGALEKTHVFFRCELRDFRDLRVNSLIKHGAGAYSTTGRDHSEFECSAECLGVTGAIPAKAGVEEVDRALRYFVDLARCLPTATNRTAQEDVGDRCKAPCILEGGSSLLSPDETGSWDMVSEKTDHKVP